MNERYIYHEETYKGYTIKIEADDAPLNPRTEYDNLGTMVWFHRDYTADEHNFDDTDDMFSTLAGLHIDDLEWEDFRVADGKRLPDMDKPVLEYGTYSIETLFKLKGRWVTEDAVQEAIHKMAYEKAVILPVAMIDHSGISIWVGNRSHPSDYGGWDSGQVGWIYCEKEKFLKETGYNKRELFEETREILSVGKTDHVKLVGDKDWAKVISRNYKGGMITVETMCQYIPEKREVKTVPLSDVTEVMCNMAEQMLEGEVKTFDDYLTGNVMAYVVKDKDGEVVESCCGFYPEHEDGKEEYEYVLNEARDIVDHLAAQATEKHTVKLKQWIKSKIALIYREPLSF